MEFFKEKTENKIVMKLLGDLLINYQLFAKLISECLALLKS